MKRIILIITAVMVISVSIFGQYPSKTQNKVRSTVYELQESGAIQKTEPQLWNVYVNPAFWALMNVEQKEQFTMICAMYFNIQNPDINGERAKVYSYQSGKKIARFNELFGFKVY